jgi:hypothetical protein
MRLIAWNCAMALERKITPLLSMRPDIAILSEVANPETLRKTLPELSYLPIVWVGSNPNKGLAIISFTGSELISKDYNPAMLAQALCKLEGFTYAPSADVYWQQGHSSESDFLYVTTQTLGPEELTALSEDVGEGRSLLILCGAFRGNAEL